MVSHAVFPGTDPQLSRPLCCYPTHQSQHSRSDLPKGRSDRVHHSPAKKHLEWFIQPWPQLPRQPRNPCSTKPSQPPAHSTMFQVSVPLPMGCPLLRMPSLTPLCQANTYTSSSIHFQCFLTWHLRLSKFPYKELPNGPVQFFNF